MKSADQRTNRSAFTRVELVVVIALLVILAMMVLLPAITNARQQARQSHCVNNLKQFGMATKQWASDHGDRYPWHIPPSEGGTKSNGTAWVHFNILSNEASTPKIFLCPFDTERRPADSFGMGQADSVATLTNGCLSYGIHVEPDARGDRYSPPPASWHLAIDRNLTNFISAKCYKAQFMVAKLRVQAQWTEKLHNMKGNVLRGDGSVQLMQQSALKQQLYSKPMGGDAPSNCTLIP